MNKDNKLNLNQEITLSPEEEKRYSRQILLSEMSLESQLKLKKSKVLIIGAGGLGSPCIMYLSGAGIGTIGIIDNDIVDESNLHRQIIHKLQNKGKNKAESAKIFIEEFNPNIKVEIYKEDLNQKNGISIFKNYDIIIDCCDNPKTRYIINDICVILNKPLISGATIRWDGQLSIYICDTEGNKLPCYRCLNPKAPLIENVKKASQVGVIGTLPGIIGTMEANECIKFICGFKEQILKRKIVIFDGFDMRIKVVKCRDSDKNCIVCGKEKIINERNIENYDYDMFIAGK
jgi:adenylyltransferase/sulfurtransferase